MARNTFGGTASDATDSAAHGPTMIGATVWTTQTGGSQITDLLSMRDQPMTVLTAADAATNGYVQFKGPDDGTSVVWVQPSAGPRIQMGTVGDGASFTGDYAYIWGDDGSLPIDIANHQYGLSNYVDDGAGVVTDDSADAAADWFVYSAVDQSLKITASGLYLVQANATFTGTGETYERFSFVQCQNNQCVNSARHDGSVDVQGLIAVDASVETPASVVFRFGSADTADSVTYAEIYVYKILAA